MTTCSFCNHRLSLVEATIGKCKCNHVFCTKHRAVENHECTFDFHETYKKEMEKKLPELKMPKYATGI